MDAFRSGYFIATKKAPITQLTPLSKICPFYFAQIYSLPSLHQCVILEKVKYEYRSEEIISSSLFAKDGICIYAMRMFLTLISNSLISPFADCRLESVFLLI